MRISTSTTLLISANNARRPGVKRFVMRWSAHGRALTRHRAFGADAAGLRLRARNAAGVLPTSFALDSRQPT